MKRKIAVAASAAIDASPTEYAWSVQVATGVVIGGEVLVEGLHLAEGQLATLMSREAEAEVRLSAEDEAELLEAIAQADRGDTISSKELFARLDRIR